MPRVAVAVLCVALVVVSTIHQAVAGDLEPPKGAGPLPDLSKGAKSGAVVTAQHAHLYRMMLPPEVASMLERGEFAFEAVAAPHEPGRFVMPRSGLSVVSAIPSTGVLSDVGGGRAFLSPVFEPPRGISGDVVQSAYKVLWNAASVFWRYNSFAATSSVLIFKTAADPPHKLEFDVERLHPRKLGEVTGSLEPIFRERISARKPAAIQMLSWLTLRFFGSGEDFLWAASPVINQIRQMTGSNRSDAIFTGLFSPDDLFVWSGKVELVEPSGLTLTQLLVPLLEAHETKVEVRDGCILRTFRGTEGVVLNHQSGRFKGSSGWVPTNTIMALRSVWRMELTNRDPFSLDARQTLYVDRDSGMPVYRVVWDDAGRLRRVVLGILRSVNKDGQPPEPILAGQVMMHANGTSRLVMTIDSFSTCSSYPAERSKVDFDPSTFVRFPTPAPVTQKKLEKRPDSEDSSD
ncbi:MAG: hypothetical protein ACK5GN_13190 [Pseudomonadota bacterium]